MLKYPLSWYHSVAALTALTPIAFSTWDGLPSTTGVTTVGNRLSATSPGNSYIFRASNSFSTGKKRFELTVYRGGSSDPQPSLEYGITNASVGRNSYLGSDGNSVGSYSLGAGGPIIGGGVPGGSQYGGNVSNGDTVAIEVDADAKTIRYKSTAGNDSGTFSFTASGPYYFAITTGNGIVFDVDANFGERAWVTPVGSGFVGI
jgi:hypothetical protein